MYSLISLLTAACLATANPLGGLSTTAPSLRPRQAAPALPLNLTYAFTARLNLDVSTRPAPIPVPGGFLVTEPIANGTVLGPDINATIHGGLAAPFIYENQTVQAPQIYIYGITSEGYAFYVEEIGTGRPDGQVTRVRLSVNTTGNAAYKQLVNGYLLASVNPNRNGTQVEVQGYLVDNIGVFQ